MKLSAQQVFNKLMLEDKILEEEGQIKFHFANVDIIVKQKDVVGNIIQEWLQGWLNKNGIDYAPSMIRHRICWKLRLSTETQPQALILLIFACMKRNL